MIGEAKTKLVDINTSPKYQELLKNLVLQVRI
jgi:hypothetical protein